MGTTVLTAHLDKVADAYIALQSPNTNTGDSETLTIGNSFLLGSNVTGRVVLKIGIDRIDPSAVITSVALRLVGLAVIASSPATFYCRRLTTTDWTEDAVTWNSPWDTPGGDYATSGEVSISVADGATELSFPGLKTMFDAARDAGQSSLYLILMGPETTGVSNYFLADSFDAAAFDEPTLTVVDDLAQDLVEAVRKTFDDALLLSSTTSLYSTRDHTTPTYVRHTGCWANITGADLTSISVWNSVDTNKYGCVLLHPQIGLVAQHVWGNLSNPGQPGASTIGASFRFVRTDGTVATGTVDDFAYIAHDIALVRFAADVTGIGVANVLPENYFDYLRDMRSGDGLPVAACPAMFTDQEEKALITMFYGEYDDVSNDNVSTMNPTDVAGYAVSIPRPSLGIANRCIDYFETPVGGDSSNNGASLFIDDKLVVTCTLLGGDGGGTSLTHHIDAINTAMDGLVSGASLTQIDLSAYRVYPKRCVLGPLIHAGCSNV